MITNKDIRVENGNLVLNGDKYPLDGQSPAAIMQIVKDNSDTTPTENSTAPATSGGVYTALAGKQDLLTFISGTLPNSASVLVIPYPTGVNKNDYAVIGWNIISNNIKYSGFNMGGSSSVRLLQIAMMDNGVQVTNDETAFFDKTIELVLARTNS